MNFTVLILLAIQLNWSKWP